MRKIIDGLLIVGMGAYLLHEWRYANKTKQQRMAATGYSYVPDRTQKRTVKRTFSAAGLTGGLTGSTDSDYTSSGVSSGSNLCD